MDTQWLNKEYSYIFVAVTSQTIQIEALEENTVSEVLARTLLSSKEFCCCSHKTHVHLTHLYCLCFQILASAMVACTRAHTCVHVCARVCMFVIFCTFSFFIIELPCSRILLRKLVVALLVLNFHTFYATMTVCYHIHKSWWIDLSPMKPVHSISCYFSKIHFNIIISFIVCLLDQMIHRHWLMLFYDYSFFYVNLHETLVVAGVYFCRMRSFQHFHWHCHFLLPKWRRIL